MTPRRIWLPIEHRSAWSPWRRPLQVAIGFDNLDDAAQIKRLSGELSPAGSPRGGDQSCNGLAHPPGGPARGLFQTGVEEPS